MGLEKVSDIFIGIIVVSMMVAGGLVFVGAFKTDNPNMVSDATLSSFNSTYNKLDEVSVSTAKIQGNLTGITEGSSGSLLGAINDMIMAGLNTIKTMWSSIGFMSSFFHGFTSFLGLPVWVETGLITIIFVVIIFAVLNAILRTNL